MSRSGKAVAGADTHADTFSVGVVGTDGVRIDVASFPATGAGFAKLGDWLEGLGVEIVRFGVEGSGGLGVHLAAYLVGAGFDVREVPGLRTGQLRRQRHRPKTDHEDSVSVALATLADPNLGPARAAMRVSAETEELAVIVAERRSLTRRRVQLLNEAAATIKALPEALRVASGQNKTKTIGRIRVLAEIDRSEFDVTRAIACRLDWLGESLAEIDRINGRVRGLEGRIPGLLDQIGVTLTDIPGIGPVTAAELVVEIGDPDRFPSEAAFAKWAGVAPMACSSAEGARPPRRYRLDLYGNRTVNAALHRISLTQGRCHPGAIAYLERKQQVDHKTRREARRAHKRQLANIVIRHLWRDTHRLTAAD